MHGEGSQGTSKNHPGAAASEGSTKGCMGQPGYSAPFVSIAPPAARPHWTSTTLRSERHAQQQVEPSRHRPDDDCGHAWVEAFLLTSVMGFQSPPLLAFHRAYVVKSTGSVPAFRRDTALFHPLPSTYSPMTRRDEPCALDSPRTRMNNTTTKCGGSWHMMSRRMNCRLQCSS